MTVPKVLAAVALAAAWIAVAVLLWQTEVPDLELPPVRPEALFTAGELERIADYRWVSRSLFFA